MKENPKQWKNFAEAYHSGRQESYKEIAEMVANMSPRMVAEWFHDYYEGYARIKGWKTQESTNMKYWDDLPKENQETMICTASAITKEISEHILMATLTPPKNNE